MSLGLRAASFSDLPGWQEDDPTPLLSAMADCLAHIETVKPYRTGQLGITSEDLAEAFRKAPEPDTNAAVTRAFFEREFVPALIVRDDGARGFVTAFYEPEVAVSAAPDDVHRHPFYRRPDDLVALDDTNRPHGLDPSMAFGRRLPDGTISAYPDRGEIDRGFLDGRGLEIAWARSRIDVFFAHVQGAARLVYPDGAVRRITYDGKAGHPFSAIGRLLVDEGQIDLSAVSMQAIRDWLAAHPDEVDRVLWHNRSYIFFRTADVDDLARGPVAAAKVPLVAGRSLAVDRLIHTFATPVHVAADSLTVLDDGKPFQRLMMALDTGSAIVGPSRGDIFTGSGDEAGARAGGVRNEADLHVLLPLAAARRLL